MPPRGMMRGTMRSFSADASVLKETVKPGTTKRILKFAAPYAWSLFLFLIVVVVDAVIGVINPLIFRSIIDNGILRGNGSLVVHLAIIVAILALADAGLGFAQAYLSAKIGNDVVLSMRTKLFEHIQRMPLAFFVRTQTGALVSRLNTDVTGAQTAFTDVLSNAGSMIAIALVLGAMFSLSWQITLASIILFPIFIWPSRFFGRKIQEITRESYNLSSEMNNVMIERFNIAGAQLAKLFGRRDEDTKTFETKATRVAGINVKLSLYSRVLFTALALMASLGTVFAYGWGGVLAIRGILDVGTIVALVAYLARLYGPLIQLSNIQVSIMTTLVSFDRMFEILDLPPMIKDKPDAVAIPKGPSGISFDHVSFHYPSPSEVSLASLESIAVKQDDAPGKTILHEITFTAHPGELIALVGPSGAGKTTITQLIPRLYDVESGSVSVNGVDVRDATIQSLYEKIGVVTQEAHLFHDTIRANLLYAKPNATDAEMTEALRAAQILPLIETLSKGLDTLVGERGYRFSGGEKQRIAIARLLLKAPDIVILDEATAHLDSESEAAIQKAFEIALAGRTSIVIAHRLSTILHADQILVVEAGRIVERGTHEELLKKGGLYADLYRRQFEKK